VRRFRERESRPQDVGVPMKAKSSKAKTSLGKPAKRAAKKPAKALSVKASGTKKKPVAAKLATKKAGPAKPAAKAIGKAPGKVARKPLKLLPKAPPAPEKPKPPTRRVPKPASIATRRKERAHFRDLLLKKRQDLMRAYAISKGDSQAELDNGTEDYVDYAVNSYAREFLLSLTELDRKHLLFVEEALNRIDRGEYGYCQQCGEDVAPKRLEVQPWARHCVRCQELEEKGLLPQFPFHVGDDEEPADEPDDVVPADEESEPEVEDEVLDDDPLVVDGDDSDE
jgi:DnaK suppressor protein